MRHENNFGEVRLPDGEGLRLQLAITDPQEACECAMAWIGEADMVIETARVMVQGTVLERAAHLQGSGGMPIVEAGQSILGILTLASRELALAKGVVSGLYHQLPANVSPEPTPALRRAVIDLRQKAWDRALVEYTAANAADARIEEGPDGVYADQSPAKFAAMLATPAPTVEAFFQKFEIVVQDILADDAGDSRLNALSNDFHALMQRRERDQAEAA